MHPHVTTGMCLRAFSPLVFQSTTGYVSHYQSEPIVPAPLQLPLQPPLQPRAQFQASQGTPLPRFARRKATGTAMTALPLFQSVLLLVDAEQHSAVERRALRDMGITKIRVFTSGVQAARVLAGQVADESFRPDIIICHPKSADMSARQFAELVRAHPRLLALPLVLVASNDSEEIRIDAVAAGFSALLIRPYSVDGLHRALRACCTPSDQHVRKAQRDLREGLFDAALQQYEQSCTEAVEPEEAFHQGLAALERRQWDSAIHCFQRALRTITLKGESELGLAAAWRGKGDLTKYRHYLHEAAHTFTRAMQWHKARTTYARLLRCASDTPSPFLDVAQTLIRAGYFEEAAETLAAGYTMGNAEDIAERLAEACRYTDNPEHYAERIRSSLNKTPLAEITTQLDNDIRKIVQEQALAAQARRSAVRTRTVGIAPRQDETLPDVQNIRDEDELLHGTHGTHGAHGAENESRSSLFANVSILGDALAVMRVTWSLLKKQ